MGCRLSTPPLAEVVAAAEAGEAAIVALAVEVTACRGEVGPWHIRLAAAKKALEAVAAMQRPLEPGSLKLAKGVCCGLMHSLHSPYSRALAGLVAALLFSIHAIAYLRTGDMSCLGGIPHSLAFLFALPTLCSLVVRSFRDEAVAGEAVREAEAAGREAGREAGEAEAGRAGVGGAASLGASGRPSEYGVTGSQLLVAAGAVLAMGFTAQGELSPRWTVGAIFFSCALCSLAVPFLFRLEGVVRRSLAAVARYQAAVTVGMALLQLHFALSNPEEELAERLRGERRRRL